MRGMWSPGHGRSRASTGKDTDPDTGHRERLHGQAVMTVPTPVAELRVGSVRVHCHTFLTKRGQRPRLTHPVPYSTLYPILSYCILLPSSFCSLCFHRRTVDDAVSAVPGPSSTTGQFSCRRAAGTTKVIRNKQPRNDAAQDISFLPRLSLEPALP